MKTLEKLQVIENTLERVTVSGSQNMSWILGCIEMLREIKKELMENASADTAVQQRDQEDAAGAI